METLSIGRGALSDEICVLEIAGAQFIYRAALRDPVLLRNIRERIRSYRRPQAAAEIVEMVLTGRGLARERAS